MVMNASSNTLPEEEVEEWYKLYGIRAYKMVASARGLIALNKTS